jgi:deoxycytidine triphosphate deaminase
MNDASTLSNGAVLSNEDIKAEMKKYPDIRSYPLVADGEGKPLDFEVKDRGLLWESCVDLRVGRIYIGDPREEKRYREIKQQGDSWNLAPGAIVHIESMERISTPLDIMGFLIPKNSKSEAGLLMLNAGHVDPGWENGFLTAEVMNVTADEFTIEIGEPLFSVVFQYLGSPATKVHLVALTDEERRSKARRRVAKRPTSLHEYYKGEITKDLVDKFLTKKECEAKRIGGWTLVGVIAAAAAALIGVIGLAFLFWQLAN